MPLPIPEPGLVVCYAYLWRAEHDRGLEEGAKNRPCVIVTVVREARGQSIVKVVPFTHSAPRRPEDAVEIPLATKHRLGLDTARSWIMINEGNEFAWPGPDLRSLPDAADRFDYGLLPPGLYRKVRDLMVYNSRFGHLHITARTA